jgi:N-acetylglucosamine kinase-like BadF-type ATPase
VPFFLGIDGGGTKTRCVVGDEKSVLGTGSGSGCNILRVGEACAQDSLARAIHEACLAAGVSPQQIARTCAGISGAADDGIASLVQRSLIEVVGGAIEVIGDMEVALEGAFGGDPGIVVIAGTGSIAYGRNTRGERARAGGWGRVVSDEGSGHWIAVKALAAALRVRDRGLSADLLDRLMTALEVRTADDLVIRVNSDPVRDYASLFPVVLASAEAGDHEAADVLEDAGRELARLAEILIDRLFVEADEVLVATHGGVFAGSTQVLQSFQRNLRTLCPRTSCLNQEIDPALGALERARREFGVWHRPATAVRNRQSI